MPVLNIVIIEVNIMSLKNEERFINFRDDMFDAISKVFEKYNFQQEDSDCADKQDLMDVIYWMDIHDYFEYENNEEFNKDFDTYDAVSKAFPKLLAPDREIIARWYENESAIDDFDSLEEFAEFIKEDIYDMLDAANNDDKNLILKELKRNNY